MVTSRNEFFIRRGRMEAPVKTPVDLAIETLEAKIESCLEAASEDATSVEVPMGNEPWDVRKTVIEKYEDVDWTVQDNTKPTRHLLLS